MIVHALAGLVLQPDLRRSKDRWVRETTPRSRLAGLDRAAVCPAPVNGSLHCFYLGAGCAVGMESFHGTKTVLRLWLQTRSATNQKSRSVVRKVFKEERAVVIPDGSSRANLTPTLKTSSM